MQSPRTIAIGDIHGCLAQFDGLLDALAIKSEDQVILLGDLVDRGPDSAGVVRRAISLARTCKLSIIKGNHEQMMLAGRDSHAALSDWLQNGGDATLVSYSGIRASLRDVPSEHWQFLSSQLVDFVEIDTHIFVHANAYPDIPLAEQPDYMLRWERCDNIAPHESGKVIVCGHTPQKSGRPMNRGYAVCLDTHACKSGVLTAMEINTGRIWRTMPDGRVERSHISDYESA